EIVTTPLNALTYTPLGSVTDTTVLDTFVASYPNIYYDNYMYKAKGYSFQGTQNDIIAIHDSYYDALYILMDHNYNILQASYYTITMQLPQTGTYYLAILDEDGYYCETRIRAFRSLPTYYIDGINGSDSRDGLTPQTAIFTLDTAIARTGGIGKFYITDDYTFNNEYSLNIFYAEIYPYGKDIKLKIVSSNYRDIISISNHLLFGEQGSNYYFILDSNRSTNFDDFLDASYYGSYLEVNNLKARNSYFPNYIFGGDQVVLRNCEFTNDTTDYSLFKLETRHGNSIKFINCSISQNYFIDGLYFIDYDSVSITFENTIVSNNLFGYTAYCRGGGKVNLTSGSWQNNNFDVSYDANGNPNLNTQNCAGIWLENSTANFGAGFTMDANNYLCIDSTSTLNITENLNGNNVAQIYPFKYDYDNNKYIANYYEGRRVLWGSTSLLANNYQKFGIAQADNSSLWYLHPDGTIHTYPVSIDQAEEGTISLYPNPASNVLNIALQGTDVNEVVVIDIYGKTALRANVAEGSNTLDISALPAGLYFVQLRADNNVKSTQKIIKR
ncbi:MAG: T9SS type A sorting domain-containing protein, partial [Bacteroidales bacterium]|nr:T9SS type A sorting domain-containing protein [Bacteroidales bacterium]